MLTTNFGFLGRFFMRNAVKNANFDKEANEKIQGKVKQATEIFDKYGGTIRAIIHFQLNDKSKEDDIFQQFFLSLVRKPIPVGIQNIKRYLYRALTNDIIDVTRRVKSYRDRIEKAAEERKYVIIEDGPENIVIKAEEMQKLCEFLEENLPSCEAKAIILRYKDNLSIPEIANKIGVNKRTVSRYICVGLKKMRQFLNENKEIRDGFSQL